MSLSVEPEVTQGAIGYFGVLKPSFHQRETLRRKNLCVPVFVAPGTPATYWTVVITTQLAFSALGQRQLILINGVGHSQCLQARS